MSHADMQHFENGQKVVVELDCEEVEATYIGLDYYADGTPYDAHVVLVSIIDGRSEEYQIVLDDSIRAVSCEVPESPADPVEAIASRLDGIEARLTALEPPQLSRDEMHERIADDLCRHSDKSGTHATLYLANTRLAPELGITLDCDAAPCGSEECAATLLFAAEVLGIHHEWEPV